MVGLWYYNQSGVIELLIMRDHHYGRMCYSPRARGVLFVLKGPYDPRVPPTVKFSQESESARLTKIILSKSTVKTL